MILPRVKKHTAIGGRFTDDIRVCPISAAGEKLRHYLKALCPDLKAFEGEDATVHFENREMPNGAYTLSVQENGIFIGYGDAEGLRNAAASLSFLLKDFPALSVYIISQIGRFVNSF